MSNIWRQIATDVKELRDQIAQILAEGGGSGGGGVTDHGALTGLADDDHAQYLTASRGDARYATPASVSAAFDAFVASGGASLDTWAELVAAVQAAEESGDITALAAVVTGLQNAVTALQQSPPSPALPTVFATLASDFTYGGGQDSTVLTITLPVGTWLLTTQAQFTLGTAGATGSVRLIPGTAVYTFSGPLAGASRVVTSNADAQADILGTVLVVTTSGTVLLKFNSGNSGAVKAANSRGDGPATNITAVKIG